MNKTLCDHCNKTIEISEEDAFLTTTQSIFWCQQCCIEDYDLLMSYNVPTATMEMIQQSPFHFWFLKDELAFVKLVPKKADLPTLPSIKIDKIELDQVAFEFKEPEICQYKYYGILPCSCGSCTIKLFCVVNRNIFGY